MVLHVSPDGCVGFYFWVKHLTVSFLKWKKCKDTQQFYFPYPLQSRLLRITNRKEYSETVIEIYNRNTTKEDPAADSINFQPKVQFQ